MKNPRCDEDDAWDWPCCSDVARGCTSALSEQLPWVVAARRARVGPWAPCCETEEHQFLHLKTKGCCLVVNRKGSCSSSQKDIVVVATAKDVD